MSELRACPFCNDEAEFVEQTTSASFGDTYSTSFTDFYIKCTGCSARSGSIRKTDFIHFTPYKVDDFRRNKNLRAKEEASHAIHLTTQRERAIAKWNVRPTLESEEM